MTEITILGKALAKPLNRRCRIILEVPEFVVRAINCRVVEANENDPDGEGVDFNDVAEWILVTEVTLRRMPILETRIPGFTAAMFLWMTDATYQPPDDE